MDIAKKLLPEPNVDYQDGAMVSTHTRSIVIVGLSPDFRSNMWESANM